MRRSLKQPNNSLNASANSEAFICEAMLLSRRVNSTVRPQRDASMDISAELEDYQDALRRLGTDPSPLAVQAAALINITDENSRESPANWKDIARARLKAESQESRASDPATLHES